MSGRRVVVHPCSQIFRYDGSLAGFYACVFESVYLQQMPMDILAESEAQESLLPEKWITTDMERAQRVRIGIEKNICPRALEIVETVFLSCMPRRELATLQFLILGFQQGSRVVDMLAHPQVAPLLKAEGFVGRERHLLLGFLRFSDHDGKLLATIEPKNFVLPLMASHFAERYSHETFMIYDKTHQVALIHENGRCEMVEVATFEEPAPNAREEHFRTLWKQFYRTIGIEARENPRCRMNHMPKRYWAHMTEMKEYL